jgi:hypothetical protein
MKLKESLSRVLGTKCLENSYGLLTITSFLEAMAAIAMRRENGDFMAALL